MTARVEVRVYDKHNSLLDVLPRRKGVSWTDDLNGPGQGSVTLHRKDAKILANSGLLAPHNILKFAVDYGDGNGFVERSGCRIESYAPTLLANGETAAELVTAGGPGLLSLLKAGVVYPESGILQTSGDSRPFGYASAQGAWYNAADWAAPLGVTYSADTVRKQKTQGWPDPNAQWIWPGPSGPDASLSANSTAFFRASFTVGTTAACRVFATGDNFFELWLDGELIFSQDPNALYGWQNTSTYDITLTAGTHRIAARVTNAPTTGGTNAAGLLVSVATVDSAGTPQSTLLRSDTSHWLSTTASVGWRAAQILKTLVTEAQTRGVAALALNLVTLGFSDTLDTAGNAWSDGRQDVELPVGVQSILDLIPQFDEMGIDIAMSPALVLNAWVQRGTDKSTGATPIRLLPARNLLLYSLNRTADLKTRELVRYGTGWLEVANTAAEAIYGRWESAFQYGGSQASSQAQIIGAAANALAANPVDTYTSQAVPITGALPYVDFDLGDKIQTVNDSDALMSAWLTGLQFTEDEGTETLLYAPELLPA